MVSEQVSLKNIILKYLEGEEFPDYFKISKMFGLSYKEIFSLLGIKNYRLLQINIYQNGGVPQFWNPPNTTEIQIYDDNYNLVYQVYKNSGYIKHIYDDLGRKLKSIDSNGKVYRLVTQKYGKGIIAYNNV